MAFYMEYPNRKLPKGVPPAHHTPVPTVGEAAQELAQKVASTAEEVLSPRGACVSPRVQLVSPQAPPSKRDSPKKVNAKTKAKGIESMQTHPESLTVEPPPSSFALDSQTTTPAAKELEGILYPSRVISPRPNNQYKRVKWRDVDAHGKSTERTEKKTRSRGPMQGLVESFTALGTCCGPVDVQSTPTEMPTTPLVTIYEVDRKKQLTVRTDLPMVAESVTTPKDVDPIMSFRERKLSNDEIILSESESSDSGIEARDDVSASDGEDWAPVIRPTRRSRRRRPPPRPKEVLLQAELHNKALMRKDEIEEHQHHEHEKELHATPRANEFAQETAFRRPPPRPKEVLLQAELHNKALMRKDEIEEHQHREHEKELHATPRANEFAQETALRRPPPRPKEVLLQAELHNKALMRKDEIEEHQHHEHEKELHATPRANDFAQETAMQDIPAKVVKEETVFLNVPMKAAQEEIFLQENLAINTSLSRQFSRQTILEDVPQIPSSPRHHSMRSSGSVRSGTTWTLPASPKRKSPRKSLSPRIKMIGFKCCNRRSERDSQQRFAEINWSNGPPEAENPFTNEREKKVAFSIPPGQHGASFDASLLKSDSLTDPRISEVTWKTPQGKAIAIMKSQIRPEPEGTYDKGNYEAEPEITEPEVQMELSCASFCETKSDNGEGVADRYGRTQKQAQQSKHTNEGGILRGVRGNEEQGDEAWARTSKKA